MSDKPAPAPQHPTPALTPAPASHPGTDPAKPAPAKPKPDTRAPREPLGTDDQATVYDRCMTKCTEFLDECEGQGVPKADTGAISANSSFAASPLSLVASGLITLILQYGPEVAQKLQDMIVAELNSFVAES